MYCESLLVIIKLKNSKIRGYILVQDRDFYKIRESKPNFFFIFSYTGYNI